MCRYGNKDDCAIKKTKKIIRGIIGGILLMYVCLIMLVNIPAIQKIIGGWTADVLSKQIHTDVNIGNVDLGLLNRLIIDDIDIKDQEGKTLLKADRMAVKLELLPLLKGTIRITNTQLFGLTTHLTRKTKEAKPNYQFLIDALSSDETDTHSKPIDLRINSFVMRRGSITYDVLSEPVTESFDINHLQITNINTTLSVKVFNADSLDITLKRLNLDERNSGLTLHNMQTRITANRMAASIAPLYIKMQESEASIDTLIVQYPTYKDDKSYIFSASNIEASVIPSDFNPFLAQPLNIYTPLHLQATIDGTEDELRINNIDISTPEQEITAHVNGTVVDWQTSSPDIHSALELTLNNQGKELLNNALNRDKPIPYIIENMGFMHYSGFIDKSVSLLQTSGQIKTETGNVDFDLAINDSHDITGVMSSNDFNLQTLTGNEEFGNISFELNADGNISDTHNPTGTIAGTFTDIEYKNYKYDEVTFTATRNGGTINTQVDIKDNNTMLTLNGSYYEQESRISGIVDIQKFNPHALNLTDKYADETIDLNISADIQGTDINNVIGEFNIHSLKLTTPQQTYTLNNTNLNIKQTSGQKQIRLHTDFADIHMSGNIQLDNIVEAFQSQISAHLPVLFPKQYANNNQFDFEATLVESDFWHHYINTDYVLTQPLHLTGHINALADTMQMEIEAPLVTNGNRQYNNTHIVSTNGLHMLSVSGTTRMTDTKSSRQLLITADAHNNQLQTLLNWEDQADGKSNGMVYATTTFVDSLGKVKTDISLHKSQITINDTIWYVNPSNISIYEKQICCSNVKVYNDNQYLIANGILSDSPTDSLVIEMNDLQVAYITDIVDFHAVRFKGEASGRAVISNIYSDLNLNADLVVNNMHLQEGRLGTAYIKASYDSDIKGIRLYGHIPDHYDGLDRTTDVEGYIAPSQNDMDLQISTHNTNAEFLYGFLSSTFSNISGKTNGVLHIIGPLTDVNLVGNISADVDMTLRATNVTYHVNPQDSIHLRKHGFDFINTRLSNSKSGTAIVNGTLAHQNMKNFQYDFDISMDNLTIYDEHEFNSDKFYATVFADGTLGIHGSDGHPLRMTADVTPTRGSVFAYDAATPDAITSGNFVTFRDVTPAATTSYDTGSYPASASVQTTTEADATDDYQYQGDIFMDISLHVNPDCEIKLRMDNVEDGYMTTYGSGTLLAHYHNKSPFSLNGIYQIHGGRYRLYLQDIIYRDLDLQDGSNVVFNGSPFDANIHLICHHTIPSVPLRDLTSSNTFSQNSKVKVICVMDITGKLDNMNFAFDLQLPNVSDETRQLVKSLITSEEEMNMQMIYLLGLQRFYTNEYARANGESGSNQAVNTLLSSTLSGQINQMLSSVIGTNSKWNFGTGITTGEQGWNDLDVEGNLSGSLLNDRLLINGNFGYRDNALTNSSNFIGDFDVRWRLSETGNTYIKAYNQTNDRYFTKATLNTQGIGITYQRNFDSWKALFRRKMKEEAEKNKK